VPHLVLCGILHSNVGALTHKLPDTYTIACIHSNQ